jgi:hypothetical protein
MVVALRVLTEHRQSIGFHGPEKYRLGPEVSLQYAVGLNPHSVGVVYAEEDPRIPRCLFLFCS